MSFFFEVFLCVLISSDLFLLVRGEHRYHYLYSGGKKAVHIYFYMFRFELRERDRFLGCSNKAVQTQNRHIYLLYCNQRLIFSVQLH